MTQTQLYCAKPTPVLVLSFGFCWCDKHHDQKQPWEENFDSSMQLIVHHHCEENSGQELNVGTLLTGLLTWSAFLCGGCTTHSGLDSSLSIIDQKIPHRLVYTPV